MNRLRFDAPAWWGGWTGQRRHESGFRLNAADLILATGAIIATSVMTYHTIPMGWVPIYVFLTFFVFCNVLRISRGYELAWCASIIAASFGALVISPNNPAPIILGAGISTQIAVSVLAWKKRKMQGILARKETNN